jgi:hypothetical protein
MLAKLSTHKAVNPSAAVKGQMPEASAPAKTVFLFDVDNTLLDNDRVIVDLGNYLNREVGAERARCYWTLFERQGHYARDPKILAGG